MAWGREKCHLPTAVPACRLKGGRQLGLALLGVLYQCREGKGSKELWESGSYNKNTITGLLIKNRNVLQA